MESPIYFVPNILSPASPNPGKIYPCSFNFSSIAAVYSSTSGYSSFSLFIPSGADIIYKNLIFFTPSSFRHLIVSAAEPPVASIGSKISTSLLLISFGIL